MSRPSNEPDQSPATQGDQPDKGVIKQSQLTGNNSKGRDLSQGSEPETLGSSGGR